MSAGRAERQTRAARVLAVTAVALAALAFHAALLGGFVVFVAGLRLSVRSPLSPLALAMVALALAMAVAPRGGLRELARWALDPAAAGHSVAALLALAVVITGAIGGVEVAGSADASGYVAEARLLASGRLFRDEPLAAVGTPPLGADVVSPLGFRPALPSRAVQQVPTYAPGLPLLMLPFELIGGGTLLVVPITGGLAVWLCFVMGVRLGDPGAGLAAAALLASTPVFLFQLLQPMSDVPATAAWLAAAVCALGRQPGWSGLAAGIAVLVRPNLAPMAIPLIWYIARSSSSPRIALTRWCAAAAPSALIVCLLHSVWYGAPWRSGYGPASELYDAANIGANLRLYATWLLQSAPPLVPVLVALGAAAFRGAAARLIAAMCGLNLALYLPYATFAEWHYLRFVLPALALALPCGLGRARGALRSVANAPVAQVAMAAGVLSLCTWQLQLAARLDVFRVSAIERRYAMTASWIDAHVPSRAVIAAAQQSGSLALNANRSVLRWDLVRADDFDHAVAAITADGRAVWLVLETWEEPDFRARHGASAFGRLDWPPAAVVTAAVPVRIYDLAGRARFLRGENYETTYVLDTHR